ncbi:MAG: PaREP1 family protein [Aigarchaeota archaeon]|nr:PaREP1 family protein [Candidatus Pelearchaeum maunauluense]
MVTLPERVLRELSKKAESEGGTLEEILNEAVLNYCDVRDPEVRAESHLKLSEKYLRECEEFLARGDYAQASEKAWGAASQMVKAIAARRGMEIRSHGELHRFVKRLREEFRDEQVSTFWLSAVSLHQNFYENWLPEDMVRDGVENVKKLVERLKRVI